MATETSFPGPGDECSSIGDAADPGVEPGPSETLVTEDRPEKAEESPHSPPTPTAPKKISFSISSILDDDAKQLPDPPPGEGARLAASTATTGPSRFDNKSESTQLTFFYRDQLLCSQKTQPTSGDGGCSADAVISSWTMPPTSPFVYREFSCSSVGRL